MEADLQEALRKRRVACGDEVGVLASASETGKAEIESKGQIYNYFHASSIDESVMQVQALLIGHQQSKEGGNESAAAFFQKRIRDILQIDSQIGKTLKSNGGDIELKLKGTPSSSSSSASGGPAEATAPPQTPSRKPTAAKSAAAKVSGEKSRRAKSVRK